MQNVRADDQAFENHDQPVEPKDKPEAPLVMTAEGDRQHRSDERDHAAEGRNELQQRPEESPRAERSGTRISSSPMSHRTPTISASSAAARNPSQQARCPRSSDAYAFDSFRLHANLLLAMRI